MTPAAGVLLLLASGPQSANVHLPKESAASIFRETATPTVTPTPNRGSSPNPKLVGALEWEQGEGSERIALFDDGTLVRVVKEGKDKRDITRKVVTTNEIDVLRRVFSETATAREEKYGTGGVRASGIRKYRLEVPGTGEETRLFTFDELTQTPLSVGRARAALEDLRSRFLEGHAEKAWEWDTKELAVGSTLARRSDGKRFVAVQDDRVGFNWEFQAADGRGERLLVRRAEIPRLFEPAGSAPATPTPTARP